MEELDAVKAEAFAASILPWRDICWHESIPIMDARDIVKFSKEHNM